MKWQFVEKLKNPLDIFKVEEELGITAFEPVFILRYKFVSDREAELVHSYYTIYDGNIQPDPVEISEGRFWKISEIDAQLGNDVFTPNFEQEWIKIAALQHPH